MEKLSILRYLHFDIPGLVIIAVAIVVKVVMGRYIKAQR